MDKTMRKDAEGYAKVNAGPINSTLSDEDRLAVALTPPADPDDFPLGKACDLSGEGSCESCQ